jgi:ABC transporter DrrB family efflux protein
MTATAHAEPRPRRGLLAERVDAVRWAIHDTWVVTGRNVKHFVRQPQLLLFSTIQPIMFVLLFSYIFGGAIGGSLPEGVEYKDFLIPGILVQSVAFRASQTAIGLAEDLERGVIDRFRSMPMARSAVIAGRSIADLLRTIFVTLLMIGVGYIIGFRFREGPIEALGAIAIVALFGLGFSWIFTFVGLTVRGGEAAQSAGFVAIFPLVFISSIFVPVKTMPAFLEWIAEVSPITFTADAARAMSIGGDVGYPLFWALVWTVGLLAVFIPLSVRRYRRMS